MSEAEKRATGWERFQEYVRKHPWRIVRRTLLILLFCAYCAYTSVQLRSPNKYYGNTAQKKERDSAKCDIMKLWINR